MQHEQADPFLLPPLPLTLVLRLLSYPQQRILFARTLAELSESRVLHFHQLQRAIVFEDLAVIQHQNFVAVRNRSQPVCDGDDCHAVQAVPQDSLNSLIRSVIYILEEWR